LSSTHVDWAAVAKVGLEVEFDIGVMTEWLGEQSVLMERMNEERRAYQRGVSCLS
jgi:hypothetical protein